MASKKDQSETLRNFISSGATTPPAREGEYLPGGPEGGRISTQGVGLREAELEELRALAAAWGLRTNAVMRLAIRYFLIGVHEGRIQKSEFVETKTEVISKPKYK